MRVRIWDNHNKQWLKAMSFVFDGDGNVAKITAMKEWDEDPLESGWYNIEGEDLKKIAIDGQIKMNTDLMPKE